MPRAIAAIGLALTVWLLAGAAGAAPILRVCADPDNLPFSSAQGSERGLYVELAELIGARMGVGVDYFWWRSEYGKRTLRETLLAGRCDAYFGLPDDRGFAGKRVLLTRPFLTVGYAVVAPTALDLSHLDVLKRRRVGVQFASPPQMLLAARGGFDTVTFRSAEEVLKAVARGEVDTAFVWGPIAGYYNQRVLDARFQVVPVDAPGLVWQVSVGVRAGDEALRTRLEQHIDRLQPEIRQLAGRYGFPLTAPRRLDTGPSPTPDAKREAPRAPSTTNPFHADASVIPVGRSLFNQHCSHCHAPNAINPDPSRDLRRLKLRYRENTTQVFYEAVTEGRPTKGMVPWKGVLSDDTIWKIFTFLESVQAEP